MNKKTKQRLEDIKECFNWDCEASALTEAWDRGFDYAKKENKKIVEDIFDFLDIHLDWENIPIEEKPIDCLFRKEDYIKLKQKILFNSSPTSQTKSLRDFPDGEHNKGLEVTPSSPPKLKSEILTSLNKNINRNKGECL